MEMNPWMLVGWVGAVAVMVVIIVLVVLIVVAVVQTLRKPKYVGKHVMSGRRSDVD